MLYEILKVAKLGATAAPDMFTGLLAQKMPFAKDSGEIAELSGAPPLSFKANGKPLLDWRITGNTVQSGTPTPTSPIPVLGVGELDGGRYKIPISNGPQIVNIYLGNTQTVRWIKKVVLTGAERVEASSNPNYYIIYFEEYPIGRTDLISTHFRVANYSGDIAQGETRFADERLVINYDNGSGGVSNFILWLQQQYSNGTPVCVWYVLVTPETATVNEPLMKIGDYADIISMADTGIKIPTVPGNNILTVGTTVQPSEVYIKYQK